MPGDSNSKPGTVTRLLRITHDWATETTKIAGYLEETRNLMQTMSACNSELKRKVDKLEMRFQEFSSQLLAMRTHCEKSQKKATMIGALEWMMKSAKDQPLAFALIFMTLMMFLILLTVLGYKLNLQSLIGA